MTNKKIPELQQEFADKLNEMLTLNLRFLNQQIGETEFIAQHQDLIDQFAATHTGIHLTL